MILVLSVTGVPLVLVHQDLPNEPMPWPKLALQIHDINDSIRRVMCVSLHKHLLSSIRTRGWWETCVHSTSTKVMFIRDSDPATLFRRSLLRQRDIAPGR